MHAKWFQFELNSSNQVANETGYYLISKQTTMVSSKAKMVLCWSPNESKTTKTTKMTSCIKLEADITWPCKEEAHLNTSILVTFLIFALFSNSTSFYTFISFFFDQNNKSRPKHNQTKLEQVSVCDAYFRLGSDSVARDLI